MPEPDQRPPSRRELEESSTQARGGEILVSSTLTEHTQSDPSFECVERGEFHFKGVLGEHAVYAVRWERA